MGVERKKEFLEQIKRVGRSSPAGSHWHNFYNLLLRHHSNSSEPRPPVPLILAASVESNASKYERFSDQLEWAIDHGCLDEALDFLEGLETNDMWNAGPIENWYKSVSWCEDG